MYNLLISSAGSTYKTCSWSIHFSPSAPTPAQSKPPPSLVWRIAAVPSQSLCFHSYPPTSDVPHSGQLNILEYKLDIAPILLQCVKPSTAFSIPVGINPMSLPQSFNLHNLGLPTSSPHLLLLSFSLITLSFFFPSSMSNSFFLQGLCPCHSLYLAHSRLPASQSLSAGHQLMCHLQREPFPCHPS